MVKIMAKTKIIDDEKNASKNYQEHSAKLKKFLADYMELSGTPLAFYLTAIEKSIEEKGILGLDNNQKKEFVESIVFLSKQDFPFAKSLTIRIAETILKNFSESLDGTCVLELQKMTGVIGLTFESTSSLTTTITTTAANDSFLTLAGESSESDRVDKDPTP
jgi:hypothetical protein